MAVIDVDALLAPLAPDAPCGEDLEYDPDFIEMERASQGKPEQQYGNTVIEAEPPDYREVKRLALKLLGRTKDLRVASHLAQASLQTDGFVAFSEALQLIRGMLEQYWETLHPRLDPDDDNDPTLRVNTLVALCHADTTLRSVREAPMVRSRTVGTFSFRDHLIAIGELPPPKTGDEPPPESSAIEAAFLDCDLESLQATAEAVRTAMAAFRESESLLTGHVGVARSADLSALPNELRRIEQFLSGWLTRRGGVTVAETSTEAADGAAEVAINGAPSAGPAQLVDGEIRNRNDAIRALDRVCEYFNKFEPSSPLPLLLQRAKRLVSKSFIDILRDLVPDAVAEAERLRGNEGSGPDGAAAQAESSGW